MGFNIGKRLVGYLEPLLFMIPGFYGSLDLGDVKA